MSLFSSVQKHKKSMTKSEFAEIYNNTIGEFSNELTQTSGVSNANLQRRIDNRILENIELFVKSKQRNDKINVIINKILDVD